MKMYVQYIIVDYCRLLDYFFNYIEFSVNIIHIIFVLYFVEL